MAIDLRSEQRRVRLSTPRLKKDAQMLLEALGLQRKTLSVLLTDDRRMARLHERWMGEPGPTDVMSFSESDAAQPDLLGDIVISAETAARRRPKAPMQEVRRYLVHGLLHLTGHDHARLRERQRMQRQERQLRLLLEE